MATRAARGPRIRAPEARPDQILDATQRLLLEVGPGATTVDAVAEAAGVGKGTIYHYYASKAELFDALRARYLAGSVAGAQAVAAPLPGEHTVERIERVLDALLDSTAGNGALIWILFHEIPGGDDDELAGLRDALLALVTEGVRDGELSVDDPELTTQFLVHGLHGVVEASFHGGEPDLERIKRVLRASVRALLGAPTPTHVRPQVSRG